MLLIAHMHNEKLALETMKSYLAADKHEQISMGLEDLHITQMPQLEYVLKGAKGMSTSRAHKKLPVTPLILRQMGSVSKVTRF